MAYASKKPMFDSVNSELANMLMELGEYEKNVNKQHFKYIAYRKAAHSVNDYDKPIKSIDEAKKLKGVGKRISEKIEEYLKKGKIEKLEKVKNTKDNVCLRDLNRVFGVGPSVAWKLYKKGISSIEDLKNHSELLTEHQKIGLKYVDDFEKPIPRDDMNMIGDVIKRLIESIDQRYHITLCGSYRRGASFSNDIDVLITHPDYVSETYESEHKEEHRSHRNRSTSPSHSKEGSRHLLDRIIEKLYEKKFLTDALSHGDVKFVGVCLNPRNDIHHRIDIRVFPYDEYFCALLYFTGNDAFNIDLRKIAQHKGFKLNEYCLKRINDNGIVSGKPFKVTCEQDIFEQIGTEYIPPEKRNY